MGVPNIWCKHEGLDFAGLWEAGGGRRGTGRVLFIIINEIYEYYEARSAISLFRMNELFSHHFRCSKLEVFDSRNVRKPIRFTDLSNKYVFIFLTGT